VWWWVKRGHAQKQKKGERGKFEDSENGRVGYSTLERRRQSKYTRMNTKSLDREKLDEDLMKARPALSTAHNISQPWEG